ncbi:MNIO family bufferin maturase [Achromobacter marplatensis]|uniref:MNIO family bufferin maturase n=1 Tax=Achromobacter marplatensis TaxID=470868 RepID=UPI0039F6AD09
MSTYPPGRPAGPDIPARAGVGLKAAHCRSIIETWPDIGFFEVHAEDYMGAGGPPHRYLTSIRERYPVSLHGVGLSIAADRPLDPDHLKRLKALLDRYQPGLFSEHLAWSSHQGAYLGDLLPAPYTDETLQLVCRHIDEAQTFLGRQMLLENPATYIWFRESTWSEPAFIREMVRRTGCGLLLDLNNVQVACTNQQWSAHDYLADFPLLSVQKIHLAGHTRRLDDLARPLLIDSHDRAVDNSVWRLFRNVIACTGALPTLIEWDTNVPDWHELHVQAAMAESVMRDSVMTASQPTKEPSHARAT